MNFLDALVDRDGAAVRVGPHRLPLPAPRAEWAERPVTLGIRPEHLASAFPAGADLVVEVELVELLGADTIVHGRLVGTDATLLTRLSGGTTLAPGDRLPLAGASRHLHLFDAETGHRLELPSESAADPAEPPPPLGFTAAAGARAAP
jgi:sn-glycerol 3-phosphate transport system ATP-binding protein